MPHYLDDNRKWPQSFEGGEVVHVERLLTVGSRADDFHLGTSGGNSGLKSIAYSEHHL